jgi:hypothetical protein
MNVKSRKVNIGLFLAFILFCLALHSISIPAFPVDDINAKDLRGACKYQAQAALR